MKAETDAGPGAAARQKRAFAPMSVVTLLGILIAAAMLPPLALSGFLLQRTNTNQQDMVATLAEATASAAMVTVDRQIQGMVSTLRGLSTANSLGRGSLEDFYDAARSALAGTKSYLIVLDKDMNQLLNTRAPYGEKLGKPSDPGPAQLALESGAVVISDAFYSEAAKKWVFNTILPWTQRGKEPRLLALTQEAEALSETLAMQDLRGGWNAVIVDRKGTVLTSTLMSSDIGKPFFLEAVAGSQGPVQRSEVVDGKSYELIVKTSEFSGWRVIVWAESAVIERPMYRTLRLLLLGAAAMIAVAGVATWLVGLQIAKSVRKISEDARRLGAGEMISASTYPVSELSRVSKALADASAARYESENEIRFLMREVAHRSKNQLTVVSSLAKQSARNSKSVADFSEGFQQRLMGLARSTDLLIGGSVAGVELGELFKVQIEPFRPAEAAQLEIRGPEFRLSLQAAQTLGLAMHEMATNAAKYGALSSSAGTLSVTWNIEGDDINITWRERLPKAAGPSDKKGFGTQLIDRTVGAALSAKIERTYHDDGLEFRMIIPVSKLEPVAKVDELAATAASRHPVQRPEE